MGVAVAQPVKVSPALPGRRYDHVFFSITIALMVATVVAGFGPSYYYIGAFRAPLPSRIIHIHAVLFSAWMILLVTQSLLVSARRVDVHRRLGIAGCILAGLMVPVGILAATDSLVRPSPIPGRDVQAFYIFPVSNVLMFGLLMVFAYRERRDSSSHKRLILIATAALMQAAVARLAFIHRRPIHSTVVSDVFLCALIAYDLWAIHKLHRTTLWAGAFLIFVQIIRFPIASSTAWHSFAAWVMTTFR